MIRITKSIWIAFSWISNSVGLVKWEQFYTMKNWSIWKVKVAQLCPTLCDPLDCAVHGILQARTLEWVAFPFSRGSYQPRDGTQVSRIAGRFLTS